MARKSSCQQLISQRVSATIQAIQPVLRSLSPAVVSAGAVLVVLPFLALISLSAGLVVWFNIPSGWDCPIYLQYGDGLPPYSNFSLPPLSAMQPYDISLRLTVPATESNFALGNFMTFLSLSKNNRTLIDTRRPSLIIPPARFLPSIVSGTPRLLDHEIPLLKAYISGTQNVEAYIELGRHDGWRSLTGGHERELAVMQASLHGNIRPRGLTKIAYAFPLITSIVSSITFFSIATFVSVTCVGVLMAWGPGASNPPEPSFIKSVPQDYHPLKLEDESDEKPFLLAQKSEVDLPALDSDVESYSLSSTETDPTPNLRRRRSHNRLD